MTILKQAKGTADGLGHESVVPSGTVYQDSSEQFHPYFIGSVTVVREIVSLTSVNSPNFSGTDFNVAGSVTDTQGRHRSNLIGSATTNIFGAFIQAGSASTSSGSIGFIKLGTPFTGGSNFYAIITACGSEQGYTESYVSGNRHTSGVNFIGAPSLRYNWIAVGV